MIAPPWADYQRDQSPYRPTRIQGPPRQPAPRYDDEAEAARLRNEQIRQSLQQAPLQDAQTRQTIEQRDTRGANFADENALRSQWGGEQAVRNYMSVLPMFGAAVRAGDNPSGDMQIITAWAKTYDPTGSVRDQDVAMAQNAQGAIDRLRAIPSYWTGEGRLRPEIRRQMQMELRTRGTALAQSYNQLREDYAERARRYGFDPEAILGRHPAIPFRDEEELLMGRRVGNMRIPGEDDRPAQDPTSASRRGGVEGVYFGTPEEQQAQIDERTRQTGEVLIGHYRDAQGNQVPMYGPPPGRGTGQGAQRVRDLESAVSRNAPLLGPGFAAADAAFGSEGGSAFRRGVADVPTMGMSDEIAAMAQSGLGAGDFNRILARERAVNRYDERNNFGERLGGQFAGGFALPFPASGIGRQAAAGAAYGGAYGLGSGEGQGRLPSAGIGAGIGLGAGAAGGAIMNRLNRRNPTIPELVDPVTGRLNAPLESASPAQRVGAARDFGIDLPLGAASDRGGAILERGLDNLPASAGIMNDSRRAVQTQVERALEDRVAGPYGSASTLDLGGQAAQRGAQNWISRFEAVTGRAYERIPISPNAPSTLGNTQGYLRQANEAFSSNPEMAAILRNPRLQRYQTALESGGLSWQDLKAFRTSIGAEIGEARFSDSPTRDQLRGLYGALSEDMRATAASQGPRALREFERANNLYAQGQTRIDDALVAILGDNARANPEAAAAAIQGLARSGRGSGNLQRLTQIRNSMRKGDEWNEVASSLIRLMGQPAQSEGRGFNPQTFVDNYSNMTEPARALLFGDGGRQELRRALDGFVAVNQRLAGSNALRNTSNTVPVVLGAGTVVAAASKISAAFTEPMAALASAAAFGGTMAANYGIGRLWTNPGFVRWATGFSKLQSAGNQNGLRAHIGRLASVVGRDPALAQEIAPFQQNLLRAVNDNLARPVAASGPGQREREEEERRRRGPLGPRY